MTTDKKARKESPMARGLLDYFPDALAYVAHVSYVGNEQHNPGEPMHWAREKSTDHADCIIRHLAERGTYDPDDNILHSGKAAWRALANLQLELEAKGLTRNSSEAIPVSPAPKYDGDWNYPNQTPGFWRVRGKAITYVWPGGQEEDFTEWEHITRKINAGFLVPNKYGVSK